MLPVPTCGKYLIENNFLYDDKTIIPFVEIYVLANDF